MRRVTKQNPLQPIVGWDFGHGEPLDLSLILVILMAESLRIASQITRNVFLATHNPFGQREQVQSIEFFVSERSVIQCPPSSSKMKVFLWNPSFRIVRYHIEDVQINSCSFGINPAERKYYPIQGWLVQMPGRFPRHQSCSTFQHLENFIGRRAELICTLS